MKKIRIGLIGYGVVGSGVAKLLKTRKSEFKKKYGCDFSLKTICDRSIKKKKPVGMAKVLTNNIDQTLNDPDLDVIVELIGGLHPAKEIIIKALKKGKHVVTANKAVISHYGPALFKVARDNGRGLFYESSVGAGIPIIKTLTEGMAGNRYEGLYGIINGTCNYILSEMGRSNWSFNQAVSEAQKLGYAESDPTLDINGMDAAHKLQILVSLAMGQFINVKDIYTEGIQHIAKEDIDFADELGLSVKLLAMAIKRGKELEARVHPTLISKEHPLSAVNGIYNAIFLKSDPLGKVMLEGEGAGQMAAASGVISDIVNLANFDGEWAGNNYEETGTLAVRKMEKVETEYYLRVMVLDKPGVLSSITGVLGRHKISIASFHQKAQHQTSAVPVVILTHRAKESAVQKALKKIQKLKAVKGKPIAIRLER